MDDRSNAREDYSDPDTVASPPNAGDTDDSATGPEETGPREGPDGREVIVPMRLYKTVVVFSTLVAIGSFIVGFLLLDAATLQVSFLRSLILSAIDAVGIQPNRDVVTGLLALAGLLSIGFGSGVYVFGTRFRFRGMGKPQEDSVED